MDDDMTRRRSGTESRPGAWQVERNQAHPQLSAVDRILLAEKIALVDGTTFADARRQVERFLSPCSP
jgi:hypothetical protein